MRKKIFLSVKKLFLRHGFLVLALATSLYAGRYLLTPNHFHTHDDIQVFRVNEFLSCFRDGQFPCRWSRDLGKGYGYPLFIFYPPIIYILPSILVALTNISITFALNLVALASFPLAAYSMYRLIYVITNRRDLAGISSILYTFLPYHAVNIFVRGVYAENMAWAIAPLLFAEVYLVIKNQKPFWLLSLLLSFVILSHNISAMLLFPMLVFWGLVVMLASWPKLKSRLWACLAAGVLAIGISAFFLLPAILEKPLVQTESMIFDYYSYLVHFPSIKQIFFSNYWGYGGSGWGVKDDGMSFALGQVHWVGLIIAGLLALIFTRQKLKFLLTNPIIVATSILLFSLLFLSHPRSTFVWEQLKILQYIQFPWRLIGLSGMLTVILLVYLLVYVPTKVGRYLGVFLCVLAIYFYGNFFRPQSYDNLTDQDFIDGKLRTLQQQDHVFDYLPKTVKELPDFARDLYFSSETNIKHKTILWQSNRAELEVSSDVVQDITLSVFVYPGWIAKVNDELVELKTHPRYGLATIAIPPGDNRVTLEFHETTTRKISNAISFVSLGILILGTIASYQVPTKNPSQNNQKSKKIKKRKSRL